MNRGKSSHIPEFKGIYYNDSKEQIFFEGGAHFKYKDLYYLLEKLKQTYPYNLNTKGFAISKNKNAFITNVTNGNKNELKTRNIQPKIEQSNTKQQLTSYPNKMNNNFFQYIQPKYMGVWHYDNNTKSRTKNQVIIPKPNKINTNQAQTKVNFAKRNQSEDPNNANNNHKTNSKSSRMYSNTQKVIEYSDKVKKKNLISARGNLTKNCNNKSNINTSNNHNNDFNQNPFAFGNGSAKEVKSRNCNRIAGNEFFDNNHSFYTKSECRKRQNHLLSGYTMDKEVMFNKTLMTRKICSSIIISTRRKHDYLDKCNQISINNKKYKQKNNGSIDSQKGKLTKSFLSS